MGDTGPALIIPRPEGAPGEDAPLAEVERWLRRRRDGESAYGFDPATGKMVWQRHTSGIEVPLDAEDRRRLRGMIFTHNHPQGWRFPADDPRRKGTSFSPHDVYTAAMADLAELRAVAPGYVFVMIPGPTGWPSPDQVERMYRMQYDADARASMAHAVAGKISPVQVVAEQGHRIWRLLAPAMGLQYDREDVGS